eukprot:TRINITY_DN28207_c0_g2_i1.p1 TRINITY_DN28207_c0_g2~~TRINITY_DN28207_c0_g2_i1.p1  ORF type:complete len:245 (-),score=44.14 TRINITY_DN28207_c0_g2_i1:44-751(-)
MVLRASAARGNATGCGHVKGRHRRLLPLSFSCMLLAVCVWDIAKPAWLAAAGSRRHALLRPAVALGLAVRPLPADAEEIPLGSVPANLRATKVGEKVTTPNGVIYEPLDLGTSEEGPRAGPPRSQANVYLKYTGHIDGFDGPIFDSTKFRGSRKPNKVDFIESRLNVDPSIPPGMVEAIKLMKVGGKGRFVCPPKLSYSEGKVAFEGDELGSVKGKVPAGSTLYYEVELVRIIKP